MCFLWDSLPASPWGHHGLSVAGDGSAAGSGPELACPQPPKEPLAGPSEYPGSSGPVSGSGGGFGEEALSWRLPSQLQRRCSQAPRSLRSPVWDTEPLAPPWQGVIISTRLCRITLPHEVGTRPSSDRGPGLWWAGVGFPDFLGQGLPQRKWGGGCPEPGVGYLLPHLVLDWVLGAAANLGTPHPLLPPCPPRLRCQW